jgi:hypothetical protein
MSAWRRQRRLSDKEAGRMNTSTQSIDEYIRGFAPDVRARLEQLRAAIARNAPQATEKMS